MEALTSRPEYFDIYDDNGGTILAIAGADFCVIAGDTRQSQGYNIQTRYAPRVFKLTDKVAVAACVFAGDCQIFVKRLKQKLEWYRHAHAKDMSIRAIARLVHTMLYGRRFMPYYSYILLGGIESDGTGSVYSFDPIGSYEREMCRSAGSANALIQPFLDNQVSFKNRQGVHPTNLPLSEALALTIDAFTGATERQIQVGDGLEIFVVLAKGKSAEGLEGVAGIEEITTQLEGERTFIVRRELKKD